MTATVREAIRGIVIAFIQTIAERSTRKDTKDENENCDFEVRHLVCENCGAEDRNSCEFIFIVTHSLLLRGLAD